MSLFDQYINAHRDLDREWSTLQGQSPETIQNHFKKQAVNCKHVGAHGGTMYKLKYRDYCRFEQKWMLACRGTMILPDGSVIRSLNKFFNKHELSHHLKMSAQDIFRQYKLV